VAAAARGLGMVLVGVEGRSHCSFEGKVERRGRAEMGRPAGDLPRLRELRFEGSADVTVTNQFL